MIECRVIHALNKVFMDSEPQGQEITKGSALQGETYSLQVAYKFGIKYDFIDVEIDSPLKKFIRIRGIRHVVAEHLPANYEDKSLYERTAPGLYPDVLFEDTSLLKACKNLWYSIWVDITIPKNFATGKYPIKFTLSPKMPKDNPNYIFAETKKFELEVINAKLPEQKLIRTEWFYNDCICMAHKVKPWAEEHWTLLEKYFKTFTAHGANMLLTPIFTPSLDTAIGGERLTTQLVKIKVTGKDKYSFDFKLLKRWVELAKKCGVKYFEFAHLFTQWGAECCPKIVADVNGKEKRIFGWDVLAQSTKYKKFLDAFLPELRAFVTKHKIDKISYFHVSDEPNESNIESYAAAYNMIAKHLDGLKIIDALSHSEFYTKGYVKLPIPSESVLDEFMKFDVQERWTYYCCGPEAPYSNRMHFMPAYANRIIGLLLYVYDVEGFLHWGFNFWNFGRSGQYRDPLSSEPDWCYPAGDGAIVYPGENGPLDSMRMEVFFHGMQDLCALRLLESLKGRDFVMKFIEKEAGAKVTMKDFPHSMEWLISFRSKLNQKIQAASK